MTRSYQDTPRSCTHNCSHTRFGSTTKDRQFGFTSHLYNATYAVADLAHSSVAVVLGLIHHVGSLAGIATSRRRSLEVVASIEAGDDILVNRRGELVVEMVDSVGDLFMSIVASDVLAAVAGGLKIISRDLNSSRWRITYDEALVGTAELLVALGAAEDSLWDGITEGLHTVAHAVFESAVPGRARILARSQGVVDGGWRGSDANNESANEGESSGEAHFDSKRVLVLE